jgi:integrase
MKLNAIIDRYAERHEYGISESTHAQLRWIARDWQTRAGKQLEVRRLTAADLTGYVDLMRAANLSDHTIRGRRAYMLAVMRWAVREGHAPRFDDRRVRKVRVRRQIVEAWTQDEVDALILACQQLREPHPSGMSWAIYWESYVRAAWDTGMRTGDLLSVERSWIRDDHGGRGCVTWVQRKTGNQHRRWLHRRTMQAIDESMRQSPDRRLIWPLLSHHYQAAWHRRFRRLVASAGIRAGSPKYLRRASITAIERAMPGCGYLHAGHTSPAITQRHYLDRAQLSGQILPPELA